MVRSRRLIHLIQNKDNATTTIMYLLSTIDRKRLFGHFLTTSSVKCNQSTDRQTIIADCEIIDTTSCKFSKQTCAATSGHYYILETGPCQFKCVIAHKLKFTGEKGEENWRDRGEGWWAKRERYCDFCPLTLHCSNKQSNVTIKTEIWLLVIQRKAKAI